MQNGFLIAQKSEYAEKKAKETEQYENLAIAHSRIFIGF